jgi:hypothetical protein
MGAGDIKAGGAFVELSLQDKFSKSLDAAAAKLKAFGSSITAIGKGMSLLGGAIVAPLLVAAQRFAAMGDEINKASQRTGIAVEQLQELKYAVEQSGGSFEGLIKGVRGMNLVIDAARQRSPGAIATLKRLGITLDQLKGLTPDQQFKLFTSQLAKIKDTGTQAAAANEIFGKSAQELLPFIQEGAAGLAALTKHARDLGIVFSQEDAEAATVFGDTLEDIVDQFKAIVFQIGAAVAKALQPFAEGVRRVLATIIAWVKENRNLVFSALAIGAALLTAGAAFIVLGATISGVGSVITTVIKGFSLASSAVGLLLNPVVLVGAALVSLAAYFLYASGIGSEVLAFLGEKFGLLQTIAQEVIGGIGDALAAGDIQLAAKILWTGLKLAWAEGTKELNVKWIGFKASMTKVAIEAFYGVLDAYQIVKAALLTAFAETANFFVGAWSSAVAEVTKVFDVLEEREREKERNRIRRDQQAGKITSGQAEKQLANVDAQANQVKSERDRKDRLAAEQREKELKDKLAAINAERDKRLGENVDSEKSLTGAAGQNASKEIDALNKEREELTKQLGELRGKAAREHKDTDRLNTPFVRPGTKLPDPVDPTQLKASAAAAGVFNIAALRSAFTGGNVQDRIATATEKTEKNTRNITSPKFS